MGVRSIVRAASFLALALSIALAGGAFGVWQMADHLVFRALYLREAPTPGTTTPNSDCA